LTANGYGIVSPPFPSGTNIAAFGAMDSAGTAIVGRYSNGDTFAFYWPIGAATITTIPPLPGESSSSDARAISGNGSVVTGFSAQSSKVWTWSPGATTARDIGFNPLTRSGIPAGINTTGTVIVGTARDSNTGLHQGFVWRSATGAFEFVGDLVTQDIFFEGVSNSGIIAGTQFVSTTGISSGMTWTSSGSATVPGVTLVGSAPSIGGISGDGSVIVGGDVNNNALKWASPFAGTPPVLPVPSGTTFAAANGVNQNGSAIAGLVQNASGTSPAVVWTSAGITDVTAALSGAPNIASFELDFATSVSTDGKTVAGNGVVNGVSGPWVARLP
jgi:uncharacterized membrane protein